MRFSTIISISSHFKIQINNYNLEKVNQTNSIASPKDNLKKSLNSSLLENKIIRQATSKQDLENTGVKSNRLNNNGETLSEVPRRDISIGNTMSGNNIGNNIENKIKSELNSQNSIYSTIPNIKLNKKDIKNKIESSIPNLNNLDQKISEKSNGTSAKAGLSMSISNKIENTNIQETMKNIKESKMINQDLKIGNESAEKENKNDNFNYNVIPNKFSEKEKGKDLRNKSISANEQIKLFNIIDKTNSARERNNINLNLNLISNRDNHKYHHTILKNTNLTSGNFMNLNSISGYLKDVDEENFADKIKVIELGKGNQNLNNNNNYNLPQHDPIVSLRSKADSITQRSQNRERNIELNIFEEDNGNYVDSQQIQLKETNRVNDRPNFTNSNNNNNQYFNNPLPKNENSYNYDYYSNLNNNMLYSTREKKTFTTDIDIDLRNAALKNKLIQSLNEKDFHDMNFRNRYSTAVAGFSVPNGNNTKDVIKFAPEIGHKLNNKDNVIIHDDDGGNKNIFNNQTSNRESIININVNDYFGNKNGNIRNNNNISFDNMDFNNNENNNMINSKDINQNQMNNNNNNLNYEISEISKISYANLNSQQNSVILNFGKKESVYYPNNNKNFNEMNANKILEISTNSKNNNILESIKLNDNSLIHSNINYKDEINNISNFDFQNKSYKNENLMLNAHDINIKGSGNDSNILNDNISNNINSHNNNNIYSRQYTNESSSNLRMPKAHKIIFNNIKKPYINNSNNENANNFITDYNNTSLDKSAFSEYQNNQNIPITNRTNRNNINIKIGHGNNNANSSNNLIILTTDNNINTNENSGKINLNSINNKGNSNNANENKYSSNKDLKHHNLISNKNTNDINKNLINSNEVNNNTEDQENNKDVAIFEENSSFEDEFKKQEISESYCDIDINNSLENKSVISSNVLSHINTPKLLTGIKSDMSFLSVNSKSENNSRLDTNNYILNNSYMNYLPTDDGLNLQKNFNIVRYKNNMGEDQEVEMMNENYDAFRYLETPKSSKYTTTSINNMMQTVNNANNINLQNNLNLTNQNSNTMMLTNLSYNQNFIVIFHKT